MAETHRQVRKGAVLSDGSEAPKRKARQSPKADSAEPALQVSPSSRPEVVKPIPPKAEAITIPPRVTSPGQALGRAQEKPVPRSSAPIVKPANSPVASANPAPNYLKSLTTERFEWGLAVAVSWAVTVVALLRLTGRI